MKENMKHEFVEGMNPVTTDFIGKDANHHHICEIKELGRMYHFRKKEIQKYCPCKIKYKDMNHEDCCDECIHSRIIKLDDSGNHITGIM